MSQRILEEYGNDDQFPPLWGDSVAFDTFALTMFSPMNMNMMDMPVDML